MENYPKVKFHVRGGGSICVTSAEQEKALGAEWLDYKPFAAAPVPIPEQPQMVRKVGNARAK
jgi:hypothetical protein